MKFECNADAWLETNLLKWRGELVIVSPFVTKHALQKLSDKIGKGGRTVKIITTLDPFAVALGALDAAALADQLKQSRDYLSVFHVENLHAKVFLFRSRALVGSANFTTGGLVRNLEVSVEVAGKPDIENLRMIVDGYLALKSTRRLSEAELEQFSKEAKAQYPALPSILKAQSEEGRLPAFPDTNESGYVELLFRVLQVAKSGQLDWKSFAKACQSNRSKSENEGNALEQRANLMRKLELVSISKDGKVVTTAKGNKMLSKRRLTDFSAALAERFPIYYEICIAVGADQLSFSNEKLREYIADRLFSSSDIISREEFDKEVDKARKWAVFLEEVGCEGTKRRVLGIKPKTKKSRGK